MKVTCVDVDICANTLRDIVDRYQTSLSASERRKIIDARQVLIELSEDIDRLESA